MKLRNLSILVMTIGLHSCQSVAPALPASESTILAADTSGIRPQSRPGTVDLNSLTGSAVATDTPATKPEALPACQSIEHVIRTAAEDAGFGVSMRSNKDKEKTLVVTSPMAANKVLGVVIFIKAASNHRPDQCLIDNVVYNIVKI